MPARSPRGKIAAKSPVASRYATSSSTHSWLFPSTRSISGAQKKRPSLPYHEKHDHRGIIPGRLPKFGNLPLKIACQRRVAVSRPLLFPVHAHDSVKRVDAALTARKAPQPQIIREAGGEQEARAGRPRATFV